MLRLLCSGSHSLVVKLSNRFSCEVVQPVCVCAIICYLMLDYLMLTRIQSCTKNDKKIRAISLVNHSTPPPLPL